MKKVVLMGLVGLGFSLLAGTWSSVQADMPAGIHGCVWRYGGVYAAPAGTMVYGRNVSTGTVYCTLINRMVWDNCYDPNNNYAEYWLNQNTEYTGIFASRSCTYWQTAMPCGSYDVWAEDPSGHRSQTHRVDWTGNCTGHNPSQDLVLSKNIYK